MSQVSVVPLQTTFQSLINKDNDVIGIFLSAKLSWTVQSANQGREALGASAWKVTIVDSHTIAMAIGFQVLIAIRAATEGASLAVCLSLVKKSREHSGTPLYGEDVLYISLGIHELLRNILSCYYLIMFFPSKV